MKKETTISEGLEKNIYLKIKIYIQTKKLFFNKNATCF